jgi:hypothetical protein
MDCADVHWAESIKAPRADILRRALEDPRLEAGCCALCEREGDDLPRFCPPGNQMGNPVRYGFRLPRAGAGDYLEMAMTVADDSLLFIR